MATAILDVLAANKVAKGVPLGPTSLAWKIGSLIKSTKAGPDQAGYHPTTIELNAAFLELVSEEPVGEAKVLLEEWAICCIGSHWGGSDLNAQDHLSILSVLVLFVSSGVQEIICILDQSTHSSEHYDGGLANCEPVLRIVQRMRDKVRKTLAEAEIGRSLTDEEELVLLIGNVMP